jgi:membrane-associated protein
MVLLFLVVAIGEIGFAAPAILEATFLAAGVRLAHGDPDLVSLFAVTIPASMLGASALYWPSRAAQGPLFGLVSRLPWIGHERWERARVRIQGASAPTVALLRLLPGFLVPVTVVSGASRLRYRTFVAGVALSDLIWNGTFLALGVIMGRLFPQEQRAHAFWWGALIALLLALAVASGTWLARAWSRRGARA